MTRIVSVAAVVLLGVLAPMPAYADDPPPTPAQVEQAKKAFAEGKTLHEAKKYAEAIEKFKESYRLSKNPLLLYNIGFTMDEAKEADMALFYYRKFLKEAPADAPQRPQVTDRVKALEEQFSPTTAPATVGTDEKDKGEPGKKQPVIIKPPGTYSATDFEHTVVDTAPPAKPLDVSASVPEDSGFVVTLFFRTAGEGKYTSKEMKWRYKEVVGRIPPAKVIGNAVHYYIEVKDAASTLVTRSGKSTSPHLVNIDASAEARFYPDLSEDGETTLTATEIRDRDEEDDDPLNRTKKKPKPQLEIVKKEVKPEEPPKPPGTGFIDVGSKKYAYTKWVSTGAAAALLAGSVVFYSQARKYSQDFEDDSGACGAPPCRQYDEYAKDLDSSGKRFQTLSKVAFGFGLAATAVAGVYWYRELRVTKRNTERNAAAKKAPPPEETTWNVTPVLGNPQTGFVGAAAMRQF